jgi:hypothetical protein
LRGENPEISVGNGEISLYSWTNKCRKTAVSGGETGSLNNWVWVNQELLRWRGVEIRGFGEGNGFGDGEIAGRDWSSGMGGIGQGLKCEDTPQLCCKGEGFCFWQDQELKLKKRAQRQITKKRKQRNPKDLTPLFLPLELFSSKNNAQTNW